MLQKREEMKQDNRGFSLVELIIVIAIMAILVAVLAPQFLKYVENSRNSADVDNAKEITNAIAAYAADAGAEGHSVKAGTYTITIDDDSNATVTTSGGNADNIKAAIADAGLDFESIRCKSKTAWTKYIITVVVGSKGDVTFSYKAEDGSDTDSFPKRFSAKTS